MTLKKAIAVKIKRIFQKLLLLFVVGAFLAVLVADRMKRGCDDDGNAIVS